MVLGGWGPGRLPLLQFLIQFTLANQFVQDFSLVAPLDYAHLYRNWNFAGSVNVAGDNKAIFMNER